MKLALVSAHTRLLGALAAGTAAFLVLPAPLVLRLLGGWDVAAAVFLVWVGWTIWPADENQTRHLATREDTGRATTGALLIGASTVSLVGVGLALARAARVGGAQEAVLTAVGVLTVALSWAAVHTVYALHYAHLYYRTPEGGVRFPGTEQPRYRDFVYLAFTVGMTFQVSDTEIDQRGVRDSLLGQSLLAYVFGTVIVAITINVVAGLVR